LNMYESNTGLSGNKMIEINAMPNPVVNEFYITGLIEPSQISIFDLNGKILINKQVTNGEQISTENLRSGIYILKINNSSGTGILKLIKK